MNTPLILKTVDDIIQAIQTGRCGEHLHLNLELKETWRADHGDNISALANKIDQVTTFLVVGISDAGKVIGRDQNWAKNTEAVISQHVNQYLDPRQTCKSVSCRETNDGWVVVIMIQNAGEVAYWGEHAYCASGTTIKRMEPNEILKLRIQLPGLTDYSKQYHKSTYNEGLVNRFTSDVIAKQHSVEIEGLTGRAPEDVLKTLCLFERQAARLLFGKTPYRLVRYDEQQRPIANQKFNGLISLLFPEFIKGLCGDRQEHLSARALKEVLANAVAHAAYFENDGEIMVEVFPDCIAVSNLCIMESTYFANRWFSRSHKTVNGLLMEALRIGGYVDELGLGKHLIFSESIRGGNRPPEIYIENPGNYQRWKLVLFGGKKDPTLVRLLERCRTIYNDDRKALIAVALVLWRDRPVSEIRDYVDGDFGRQFAEVLASSKGPIFYYRRKETIWLTRWAEVLLGEGKDSKALSAAENERLQAFAFEMCTEHHGGTITPKLLRDLGDMGETKSEKVLSSDILAGWAKEDLLRKTGKGKYEFLRKPGRPDTYADLLNTFQIPPQTPDTPPGEQSDNYVPRTQN